MPNPAIPAVAWSGQMSRASLWSWIGSSGATQSLSSCRARWRSRLPGRPPATWRFPILTPQTPPEMATQTLARMAMKIGLVGMPKPATTMVSGRPMMSRRTRGTPVGPVTAAKRGPVCRSTSVISTAATRMPWACAPHAPSHAISSSTIPCARATAGPCPTAVSVSTWASRSTMTVFASTASQRAVAEPSGCRAGATGSAWRIAEAATSSVEPPAASVRDGMPSATTRPRTKAVKARA